MLAQDTYTSDERFMLEALAEARLAADLGEVPIGAVVVHEGKIIARAHNMRESDEDPSAHAEFSAMVAAARALGRWRLSGCTVYVTLEPCPMCAGLMVNSRIDRCVYGASDSKAGALGTLYNLARDHRLNHSFEVESGVLADECASVLSSFFGKMRARRAASGAAALEDAEHLAKRERDGGLTDGKVKLRSAASSALPGLRVMLAIDSFKGSVTSEQAERWIAEGVRRVVPDAAIESIPLGDGGEGTVSAASAALDGHMRSAVVRDPFGRDVRAEYLLAGDGSAVIEMASAAGMSFSSCTHDEALRASSFGVGELVLDAVASGARTVYLGLGGSATTDGGAGFLQALGARLLDANGVQIASGLEGLLNLRSVDLSFAIEALRGVELVAWTDVDSPLVGARGAVRVFGPQKGLADLPTPCGEKPTLFDSLDRAMVAYAALLDRARTASRYEGEAASRRRFRSVAGVPGAGAAGGLGAAMLALGARLDSGADSLLDLVGFDERVRDADLVITGEGRIDAQTSSGKMPARVAARAARFRKPVVAVAGGRDMNLDQVYAAGIDLVVTALREPMSADLALTEAETRRNLVCAGEAAARSYLLGRF